MNQTLYWHDYETWGLNAHYAQPAQFAGIRTDLDLNEIGDELNILAKPLPDYLPDPGAVMVTGITPQQAIESGLPEPEFAAQIYQQLSQPGTIGVGYNSLRFDDEFSRVLFYRNLLPPYEREYQNNNNRWDILDLVRATRALRPEGINWPEVEGEPSNRLEHLTAANRIDHAEAHDALSDVRATISLAKLIRTAQPKLYNYAFSLRDKSTVQDIIGSALSSGQLLVHTTGKYKNQLLNTSLVRVLGQHPRIKNQYVVYDLRQSPAEFAELNAEQLKQRLFGNEQQREGNDRLPVKTVAVNKSPFVAPLNVLDQAAQQRIGLSIEQAQANAELLGDQLVAKIIKLFGDNDFSDDQDPDAQLYSGFIADGDSRQLARLRQTDPSKWQAVELSEQRLQRLAQRYRARHYPQTLSEDEQAAWAEHIRQRLLSEYDGRFMTFDEYGRILQQLAEDYAKDQDKSFLLEELQLYGQLLYPVEDYV